MTINNRDDNKLLLAGSVKRLRAYAGLSQRELAKKTGITQADICKIECGNANPSLKTLSRIAAAAGARISIDFIYESNNTKFIVEDWGRVSPHIAEVCASTASMVTENISSGIDKIVLYGSCARGENSDDSDVDIALLTDCDRITAKKYAGILADIATSIMERYQEVVNFVCLPITEYNEKKTWYPYFKNIEEEGIVLYARRAV